MRPTILLLELLAISVVGCRNHPTTKLDPIGDPATLTSARSEPPTWRARMRDHDSHGAAMRDAVIRADLLGARREGRFLANLRVGGGIEPPWRRSLDAINTAAARVAQAKDLAEASHGVAAVAQTCGNCHATLGGPAAIVGEAPHPSVEVVPRMQRHEWAAERLWDGLIVPSDAAWKAGARALADAPLVPESRTPGKTPVPEIGPLARSVQDLGRKASVVEAPIDRDAIYGELVSTCSGCHARVGSAPTPGSGP